MERIESKEIKFYLIHSLQILAEYKNELISQSQEAFLFLFK